MFCLPQAGEAGPQVDIGILHFPFHDLGMSGDFPSRWGHSHYFTQDGKIVVVYPQILGDVSRLGHVRAINDFGIRVAQSELF